MPSNVKPLGQIQLVPVGTLSPSATNPRRIPQRAVEVTAASLKRFGWQQPLVVDSGGELIVGHTRLQAAKLLKLTEVPVIVADDLTEDEVKAYRIADNRTHDFTTWDLPELVIQLDELAADFSAELALEDWQAVVTEFEADTELELTDDAKTNMSGEGFELVVVFTDEASAVAVEQQILDLPGALDVRHKQQ